MFPVTGLDNCRSVFKQEVQATAPHVHTQPALGAGEHSACHLSRVSYYFLSVNPQIVLVWSPVLVMHRDDRLELCGERG